MLVAGRLSLPASLSSFALVAAAILGVGGLTGCSAAVDQHTASLLGDDTEAESGSGSHAESSDESGDDDGKSSDEGSKGSTTSGKGGSSGSKGTSSGSTGTGTGSTGTGTGTTTGSTDSMSGCVPPGSAGNSLGIGADCGSGQACKSGLACSSAIVQGLPAGDQFCAKIGCQSDSDCGEGAVCYNDPQRGSACMTPACKTLLASMM